MELKIGDFLITSDPLNFILHQWKMVQPKQKDKEASLKLVHIGYYASVKQALNRVLQENIRGLDESNVMTILDCIKQTEKNILKAVKEHESEFKKERIKKEEENE